nr:hypothetical protein BaRGS_003304 [Batillaria attramentaria]
MEEKEGEEIIFRGPQIDPYKQEELTYQELVFRVEQLGRGLMKLGMRRGTSLCLFAPNSVDSAALIVATHAIGAIVQASNHASMPVRLSSPYCSLAVLQDCPKRDGGLIGKDDTVLLHLPFFHAYGQLITMVAGLALGCRLVVMAKFELTLFLIFITRYKVTALFTVPPVVIGMLNHPRLSTDYDLSSLRFVSCGAAPLGKETHDQFVQKLGQPCLQGYGMTENLVAAFSSYTHNRTGSAGRPLPNMEFKIVDPDTGKSVGVNQTGELCMRGPMTMKGYHRNPEATQLTIDSHGWLHSGDVARFDSDGFLYIVERIKELIKYKGEQVPPAILEDLLLSHPDVADVCVIGKPDPVAGELPRAYIVRTPGATVTERQIKDFVARNVPSYMELRGGVEFRKEIPKSPSGQRKSHDNNGSPPEDQPIISSELAEKIIDVLDKVRLPLEMASGLVTFTSACVYLLPDMRSPTAMYLVSMNLLDTVSVVMGNVGLIWRLAAGNDVTKTKVYNQVQEICLRYLAQWTRRCVYCLAVLVSLERFFAISFPLKARFIKIIRFPKLSNLSVIVVCGTFHVYQFLAYHVVYDQRSGRYVLGYTSLYVAHTDAFNAVANAAKFLFSYLPLVAGAFLSVALYVVLRRSSRARATLHAVHEADQAKKMRLAERQLSRTIWVSNALFTLLSLPINTVSLVSTYHATFGPEPSKLDRDLYVLVTRVALFLLIASRFTNFLSYASLSTAFRRNLLRCFRPSTWVCRSGDLRVQQAEEEEFKSEDITMSSLA